MEPRIEYLAEKKLVGKHSRMSLSKNGTFELWQSFMKQRKEVKNPLTSDLISMQVYDESLDFRNFDWNTEFEKWATVEVADYELIPEEMSAFVLPAGLYAVFVYKGRPQDFADTFRHIMEGWQPESGYEIDQRPHFEVLGAKYKKDDPNSEEDVWIPIKPKR